MDKVLPLSLKHNLMCYGDSSHNDAICSSEEYLAETLTVISDLRLNSVLMDVCSFSENSKNLHIQFKNNEIFVTANKYDSKLKSYLYFRAQSNTELSFKVNFQVPTSPWACISAFCSESMDFMNEDDKSNNVYQFGRFVKRGFYYCYKEDFSLLDIQDDIHYGEYSMKIIYDGEVIRFFTSYDSDDWCLLLEKKVILPSDFVCGITIDFNEFTYYNWLFSRHIQIVCEKQFANGGRPIDYFYADSRSGIERHNPFIKEYCIPQRLINVEDKESFFSFVKSSIDNYQYVDLCLNEFYINMRSAYKRYNFMHYSLVYGYNEATQSLHILGYDDNHKLNVSVVSVSDVFYGFINANGEDIYLRKYYLPDYNEKLNVKEMINEFSDYLSGIDSAERYPYTCQSRPSCCFGIDVYDNISQSDENLLYLYRDLRIPYFIYESKALLKERILFLSRRLNMNEKSIISFEKLSEIILNESQRLLLLSIKKHIKNGDLNLEQAHIVKCLTKIKKMDRILFDGLIQQLNKMK